MGIIDIISFFLIIIFTSLTVPTQPSPRFHVEACYLSGTVQRTIRRSCKKWSVLCRVYELWSTEVHLVCFSPQSFGSGALLLVSQISPGLPVFLKP